MHSPYALTLDNVKNSLWQELGHTTVYQAVDRFLSTLTFYTERAYRSSFKAIFPILYRKKMIDENSTLQTLCLSNLENILDCIYREVRGKEATKTSRCSAFIGFTKYLERTTQGMMRPAKPIRGIHFRKIRLKAHTKAITHEEWNRFINELKKHSMRDYLIAKAIFQGAKRASEVLTANIGQIDWENGRISYKQSKSVVISQKTVISYSKEFMRELKEYLGDRTEGPIFLTRRGKKVTQPHLYRSFAYASSQVGIRNRVHPHVLRTTSVTLLMKMGYHSDDIMKISGHATPAAVLYYDKSPDEENLTTQVKLC